MLCLLHQHKQTIFQMSAMTLWQSNKQVSQSSHKELLERYRTNALLMLTTRKTHKMYGFTAYERVFDRTTEWHSCALLITFKSYDFSNLTLLPTTSSLTKSLSTVAN